MYSRAAGKNLEVSPVFSLGDQRPELFVCFVPVTILEIQPGQHEPVFRTGKRASSH